MTDASWSVAARSAEAAAAWLSSLDPERRASASHPFDSAERMAWDYRPGERVGLSIGEMTAKQAELAMVLVDLALSERAAGEVRSIIAREPILGEIERAAGRSMWSRRDARRYWFAVLGAPGEAGPWAWSLGGHHVSVHLAFVGGAVAPTPLFLGANPATVTTAHGPDRLLGAEETLARDLVRSLSDAQKATAIVNGIAPADILTTNDSRVDPRRLPTGIRHAELDPEQRHGLERLVRHYVDRTTPDLAARAWAAIASGGLDDVSFAWAGPEEPGSGHYYVVRAGDLILEYDNTQDGANHVHSVWRAVDGDWGTDLLAAHYAAFHRP